MSEIEKAEHVASTPVEIPVAEFEGEYIRQMVGKLPAITMDMPVGYARGTHLKMEVEVRIRDVSVKEVGKSADLIREHTFALENIELIGAYTADQLDPGVGGSAALTEGDLGDFADDGDDLDERSDAAGKVDDEVGF